MMGASQIMPLRRTFDGNGNSESEVTPARRPEVSEQLDRLEEAVEGLRECHEQIFAKIAPVIGCGKPANEKPPGDAPKAVLCQVAERIREITKNLRMLESAAMDYANRIQV